MRTDGMAPEGSRSLIGVILTSFLRIISSHVIWQYAGMGNNMTENDLLWQWFEGLNILSFLVPYWFEAAELLVYYWSTCVLALYATPFVGSIPYIGHLLTLVIASMEVKTRYTEHRHDVDIYFFYVMYANSHKSHWFCLLFLIYHYS